MRDSDDQDPRDHDGAPGESRVNVEVGQDASATTGDIAGQTMYKAEGGNVHVGDVHHHHYSGQPPRDKTRRAPAAESGECPYPGMVPFEDARFFYGRDAETTALVQHIRDHKVTLLVGPSGSGKSSLLRAGVEPALAGWPVCRVRLGDRPCAALCEALGMGEGDLAAPLAAALDVLLAERAGARVLVMVDPLEELFLATADEQAHFCELVGLLADDERCAPVFALRADFYAELMASELWDLAEHSVVHVRPPGGDALREAIREPAHEQGVTVEDALVEHLMADAAGEPGVLPLLQETLRWLWEERERRELGLVLPGSLYAEAERTEHGERVRPLAATLARKADVALADLAKADRVVARRVMVRLVQFGEGRPHTRRQQKLEDLAEGESLQAVQRVVQHLAERRMLALSGEQGEGLRRVDLAHEALIHAWPTFKEWIKEWREAEEKRRRFEARAEEWVTHGRRGGLLDAVALAEAEEWLASEAAAQVGASEDLRGLAAASRHVLRRARLWRRIAVSVLVVLLGAATVFGVLTTRARAEAERQRAMTERLYQAARNLVPEPVAADPDLANSHFKLGKFEEAAGNPDQARMHHMQALEIVRKLAEADPGNAGWQRGLSVSHIKLGDMEKAAGNLDQARAHYKEGLGIMKKLAEADPGNAVWQRDLSVSHERLGDMEGAAGNLDQARAHRMEIARKLAEADPGNAGWQRDLIASEVNLALVNREQRKLADARRHLDAAKAVLARIDAAGMLRGDALLEQWRQYIAHFERELRP
jgi:tetratricopeptide (TPR) repeat protein